MSDVNDNLAGSIMEEKQGTFLVTLNLRADAQFNLPFTIKTNNATIARSVGSFNDILKIGDTCSMTWAGGTTTFDIVSINSSGTILTYGNVAGDALIDFADDTAFIICTSDLPDLILNYGIVDNAATTEFVSFIDGTTQGWYVEAMSLGGAFEDASPVGQSVNQSWINGSMKAKWLTKSNGKYTFEVVHTFVVPYYEDGQLVNVQTLDIPTEYEGSQSPTYVGSFTFLRAVTNPNSGRSVLKTIY